MLEEQFPVTPEQEFERFCVWGYGSLRYDNGNIYYLGSINNLVITRFFLGDGKDFKIECLFGGNSSLGLWQLEVLGIYHCFRFLSWVKPGLKLS